jgi:hypothetical protein
MKKYETNSTGTFISNRVLYAEVELTHTEQILCATIDGLSKELGYCFARNQTIAYINNMKLNNVKALISIMYKKKIIVNNGTKFDRQLVLNPEFFPNKDDLKSIQATKQKEFDKITAQESLALNILNDYVEEPNIIEAEEFKLDSTPLSKAEIKEQFFNNFWSIYPVNVKKINALKIFKRLSEKDIQTLMSILPNIVAYHAQPSTKELFIPHLPHPTTFINGRRWEDEIYKNLEVQTSSDEVVATEEPFADMILHDENREDFKNSFIIGSFENLDKQTQEAIRRTNISLEQFNLIGNRIGFISQVIDFINASVGITRFPTYESGLIDLFLKSVPNGRYISNDVFTSTQLDEMFKLFLENGIDFALFRFLKIFGEHESARG